MTETVQGIIFNYSVGPRSQRPKECIIQFAHVTSFSDASKLIGRKVVWSDGKNRMIGKIVRPHGIKGLVIVRFRKGVPGQALGTMVELVS